MSILCVGQTCKVVKSAQAEYDKHLGANRLVHVNWGMVCPDMFFDIDQLLCSLSGHLRCGCLYLRKCPESVTLPRVDWSIFNIT